MTEPDAPLALTPAEAQVLAVEVGGVAFGLPVGQTREVVRVPDITRLPFPPPSILGVVSIRGELVPVLDLGARLLRQPSRRDGRLLLVVDPATGSEVALLVDAILGLSPASGQEPSPPAEVEAALPAGWVAGVVTSPTDRLITLLELAPVLAVHESDDKEPR